ncbi:MAG: ribokinase [Candidatus Brocadiia bacterium]
MTKPQVVVVGSSNTDMVVRSTRLPRPGESVVGGHFYTAAGGKGANQAVAAARAGAQVALVAKLGRDMFGDRALEGFRQEGIDCQCVARDPQEPSGVALILVDAGGENLISVALGANMRLTPGDVERAASAIAAAGVLVLQLEVPLEAVCCAAAVAHDARVPVVLNPAPAPAEPLPADLLRAVDYLVLNETEMDVLAGSAEFPAARCLLDAGVGHVILTRGRKGIALLDGSQGPPCIAGHEVKSVDAVGAGDAFVGALACFLAEGRTLRRAIELANAAAALSVTRQGAQPSLPRREEIVEFLGKSGR